jgi:hypothetical protein
MFDNDGESSGCAPEIPGTVVDLGLTGVDEAWGSLVVLIGLLGEGDDLRRGIKE